MAQFKMSSTDIQEIIGECEYAVSQMELGSQKIESIVARLSASWIANYEGEMLLNALEQHNKQSSDLINDLYLLINYLKKANLAFQTAESELIKLVRNSD